MQGKVDKQYLFTLFSLSLFVKNETCFSLTIDRDFKEEKIVSQTSISLFIQSEEDEKMTCLYT